MVKKAFDAQREFIVLASKSCKPSAVSNFHVHAAFVYTVSIVMA